MQNSGYGYFLPFSEFPRIFGSMILEMGDFFSGLGRLGLFLGACLCYFAVGRFLMLARHVSWEVREFGPHKCMILVFRSTWRPFIYSFPISPFFPESAGRVRFGISPGDISRGGWGVGGGGGGGG